MARRRSGEALSADPVTLPERLVSLDPAVWLSAPEREQLRRLVAANDDAGLQEFTGLPHYAIAVRRSNEGRVAWIEQQIVRHRRRRAGWVLAELTGEPRDQVARRFRLGFCSRPKGRADGAA